MPGLLLQVDKLRDVFLGYQNSRRYKCMRQFFIVRNIESLYIDILELCLHLLSKACTEHEDNEDK